MTFSDVNDGDFKKSGGFGEVFGFKISIAKDFQQAATVAIESKWMFLSDNVRRIILDKAQHEIFLEELHLHNRMVDHKVCITHLPFIHILILYE